MKELFKNKAMIIFATFILSITYIHSLNTKKMEENTVNEKKQYIALNLK